MLNLKQMEAYASLVVHGGKSFPEPMQLEPLAHRLGRAALTDLVVAMPAVHAGAEGETLQAAKKMSIGLPMLCREDQQWR